MEVRLLAVTSNVGNRGRALGVVIALAMVGALLSAQTAFGAGDPVASGTFGFKLSSGFKHQLKSNGVKLKPKAFKIKTAGSSVDPITGAGTLKLGKITFKKGNKKVVYGNAKATLGANGGKGNIKGSTGKLFSLKGGKVTRNGFGATVSGVKVKLLKSAAKKINKALGLHSLHPGSAAKLEVAEQPSTVQIVSGTATVKPTPPPILGGPAVSVTAKLQFHCVDPPSGVVPIQGATQDPLPDGTFHFPVTGGTVGPTGKDGVLLLSGAVQLSSGAGTAGGSPLFPQPAGCSATPNTTPAMQLQQGDLAPNLLLGNVGATVNLTKNPAGVLGSPQGAFVAIGQAIDTSKMTVVADPTAKTVKIAGAEIRNNATSSQTLNLLFPNKTSPLDATKNFADGDDFGTATLTVSTR
jgi:hypothetical protein